MSNHIYKMVELVGSSDVSTDDAVQKAIARASKTVRNLDWFEVVESRGNIKNGQVSQFQVKINAGFRLEE